MCLVLSAFDTLPEDQFVNLIPYLQVLVDKAGLLFLLWLLPLLPLGAVIQAIGLMKEHVILKYQGMLIIIGLLLLNNPEIELISIVGGLLMCIGYIPWGLKELTHVPGIDPELADTQQDRGGIDERCGERRSLP